MDPKENSNPNEDSISHSTLNQNNTIWYIQVLSFFGSVIAGLFFLLFLGILDFFDSDGLVLLLGIFTIAVVSVFSFSLSEETKESRNPILLSFFLQGQVLFFFGLDGSLNLTFDELLWIIILFQIVFYFYFNNSINKILAVLLAFSCLLGCFSEMTMNMLYPYLGGIFVAAVIYFSDTKNLYKKDPYLFYSLSICFLGLFILPHIVELKIDVSIITSFVFLILAIQYLIYDSFKSLSKNWLILYFVITLLLFLPLLNAPGVLAAHIIIYIGFRKNSIFITNFGRLALIGYFFILYYQMEITLLQKSFYMLGSGALFLITYLGWVFYEKIMEPK